MEEKPSLSERVSESFKKLSASATQLNAISDELGKSISALDESLRQLNLGVSTWVAVHGNGNSATGEFWEQGIGYAKVRGRWGIALRTVEGSRIDPGFDRVEEWLFNDAPRAMRVDSVSKLPDLLEKLVEVAGETTEKIRAKIAEAEIVAASIRQNVNAPRRK
jgi:hypothetical protein